MSKYTTEVRYICEHYAGLDESKGLDNVTDIIAQAKSQVFDFDFPIYDENYRSVLETKILKHYYTREIGAESVGLWKLWLDTRLNEIMPYYNDLYKSALLEFNPLIDTDFTSQHTGESAGTSEGSVEGRNTDTRNYQTTDNGITSSESSGTLNGTTNVEGETTVSGTNVDSTVEDNWNYYSDTPQGGINGLSDNTYLTNATHNSDTATGNHTSNGTTNNEQETNVNQTNSNETNATNSNTRNETGSGTKTNNESRTGEFSNTDSYIDHVVGKRGTTSYSNLIMEFRKTLINIDMMIIDELGDLFMNVW